MLLKNDTKKLVYSSLNLKFLFVIIVISVTIWIFFVSSLTTTYIDSIKVTNQKTEFSSFETRNDCNPILEGKKQFRVKINGHTYPKIVYLHENETINFDCLNKNKKTKIISIQTPIVNDTFFGFKLGHIKPFENIGCPVTNCEVTSDTNKLNISDLVLFETGIYTFKSIPRFRFSNQRYVFVLYETPINSPNFRKYKYFFNLSSTYDEDSDFPGFYWARHFKWVLNEKFNENFDFYGNKRTKFSAAVISNCQDKSNRLGYLKELNKYVPVEIFGKCGKKCPEYYEDSHVKDDCKTILSKEYLFLLAFENSVCKDYITEKFFTIFRLNIIPVVRGGGQYENYIPKSAYINANDFKSPQHLAKYLLYLSENKTAYNEYFKWKKYISFYSDLFPSKNFAYSPICDMCIKLHLEDFYGIKTKIIKYPHVSAYCKNYSPIFNYICMLLLIIFILIDFIIFKYYICVK